jgi:hypothetical protein
MVGRPRLHRLPLMQIRAAPAPGWECVTRQFAFSPDVTAGLWLLNGNTSFVHRGFAGRDSGNRKLSRPKTAAH